jgi:hypothetical protein
MANKFFGIGLSRTGTTSLNSALCVLGINSIHYPEDDQTYQELMRANYRLSVLETHQAVTDIPVAPFYPQLDRAYPGSKFILTVREREEWLTSVELHYQRRGWDGGHAVPVEETLPFVLFMRACVYGCYNFDRERFSYVYDLHLKNVRAYFAHRPQDLLILNICCGEGWERLCPFLGKLVPPVPFPHENRRPAVTPWLPPEAAEGTSRPAAAP